MFARVRLLTDEKTDSMVVPEQALVPQGADQFVFKVADGRAQRVKVEIGQRRDGKVEILRGLAPAEVVVTAGHLKIRDGTAVRLAGAPADGAVVAQAAPTAAPQVAQAEVAGQKNIGSAPSVAPVKQ
jgi:membrane fusion protein (multidrug efflux system)